MNRKFLSILLSLLTVISLFSAFGTLAFAETEGDWEYTVNSDNTVTVTGYNGSDENLVIPSTLGGKRVSTIDDYAFSYCSTLKTVKIQNGVNVIGEDAFESCENLLSVELPDSVWSIKKEAFWYCEKLNSINLPSNLKTITDSMLLQCESLEQITIPDSVTKIEGSAFYDCSSLKSIKIPEGVTEIPFQTFYKCSSLKSVVIPSGVNYLGPHSFGDCAALKSVTVLNGDCKIENDAFEYHNAELTLYSPKNSKVQSFAESQSINFMPLSSECTVSDVALAKSDVKDGDESSLCVTVRNTGSLKLSDSITVTFMADGRVIDRVTYTDGVEAGDSRTIRSAKTWHAWFGSHQIKAKITCNDDSLNSTLKKRVNVKDTSAAG